LVLLSLAPPTEVPVRTHGVRLTLTLDGVPHARRAEQALTALFTHLDRDGDGTLSPAELALAPAPLRIRQWSWNYFFTAPGAAVAGAEVDTDHDERVSRAEFAAYYQRHGIGRPLLMAGVSTSSPALADALRTALDTDRDGQLSAAELAAAPTVLARWDRNDDELISPSELVTNALYPTSTQRTPLTVRAQPGATHAAFDLVTGSAPHACTLGTDQLLIRAWPGRPLAAFELAATETIRHWRRLAVNGAVTHDALTKAPGLRDLFALADRDGDGRLTLAEWEAWLGVQQALLASQVQIEVQDCGSGLFEWLDADGDGVLSVRELRSASQRSARVDVNRLPRHWRVAISQGPAQFERPAPLDGPDWFRALDRNRDGDVSPREFLGTPAAFAMLDRDGDGLISGAEAKLAKR
jgi:Ca2+-binding EF-hand superfamily protein